MIADTGDGRLYMVEDIGALPKIFMKETQEAQKTPARRGPDPRARRQEGRGDRGHRRRERAAAARLRHDQAQADRRDDPDLRPRRADPRALALRRRHVGRVDLRRQEPLVASTGSAGAAIRSSGRRSSAASMRRKVYDSYDLFAKVADGRAQVTVDAIDSGDKFVNELDTELAGHRPGDQQGHRRPCRWSRPRPAATPPTSRSRSTAATCSRPCTSATARPSPSRSARSPCPTRSSTCARRRIPSRCKHAAQVSGGHDQAKPAQVWDAGRREGRRTRRTCGRTCCSRVVGPVPARPLREARAPVRLPHDQVQLESARVCAC